MDSNKGNCGEKWKKRPRLSLSLKNRRFASPLTANEMRKVCEGFNPQNTDWTLGVLQEWLKQRDNDQCPSDLLERPSAEKLNYWLSCFIVECRQVDGQPILPVLTSTIGWIQWMFIRAKRFWKKSLIME